MSTPPSAPAPSPSPAEQPKQRVLTLTQSLVATRDLQKANRLEEARGVIQAALRAAPGSADAHSLAAGIELQAGRPDLALPLAQRAAVIDGPNPERHRAVGKILRALGRDSEAAAAFDQALDLMASRPPSGNPADVNWNNPTHHLQARPVNHVVYRRSRHIDRLMAGWLDPKALTTDDLARFYFLADNVAHTLTRGVQGDLAELGVWRGQSARVLRGMAPGRMLYLFDTFAGFPADQIPENDSRRDRNLFTDTSLDQVRAFVGTDDVVYIPGVFPDTVDKVPADTRFCFVHIDCDLGKPAQFGLEFFYPRVNSGGLIVLHDYGNDSWPGVAQAVDGFLADKPEGLVLIPDKAGSAVIIKH
ncbi:MAG TPA: TylF/MycF/NovP-related O-methyltransferase [Magnetospirillaceae bacterium]